MREEFGASVPRLMLSQSDPDIPPATNIVVAFGAKAALRKYPDGITLIYALAPGLVVPDPNAIKINMTMAAARLLLNLRKVTPGLKRLGVPWKSRRYGEYAEKLSVAGRPLGIEVNSIPISGIPDIPDGIRSQRGRIDSLWLPPDPLLINAESLAIFVEFSRANAIALFVPTSGLVAQGAIASVAPTFREMGRLAAIAARRAPTASDSGRIIYPERAEIVINKGEAARIGLTIPDAALRSADQVIP